MLLILPDKSRYRSDSAIGFQGAGYVLDKVIDESFRDSEEIRMVFFFMPEA